MVSEVGRSVVNGRAADVVVGVEESFGQQGAHVTASESVDDPLAVAGPFDQAGKSQFGQVLAGDGRSAPGQSGETCDVKFSIAQSPQHPDACRFSKQGERCHCCGHLIIT